MEDSNPQEVSLMSVFWTAALPLGESSVYPLRSVMSPASESLRHLASRASTPACGIGGRYGSRTHASEDMSLVT